MTSTTRLRLLPGLGSRGPVSREDHAPVRVRQERNEIFDVGAIGGLRSDDRPDPLPIGIPFHKRAWGHANRAPGSFFSVQVWGRSPGHQEVVHELRMWMRSAGEAGPAVCVWSLREGARSASAGAGAERGNLQRLRGHVRVALCKQAPVVFGGVPRAHVQREEAEGSGPAGVIEAPIYLATLGPEPGPSRLKKICFSKISESEESNDAISKDAAIGRAA